MPDDRPSRYVEDGKVVYRASALGHCPRVLVAIGLGMTPEPFSSATLERFRQGVEGEPVVLGRLANHWHLLNEESGWWLHWDDGQVLVEWPVGERVVLRGHCDGVGTRYVERVGKSRRRDDQWNWSVGRRSVVEVKCVSAGFGAEIERRMPRAYAWQCSVYGHGLKLPVVLCLGEKDDGGVVRTITEMDVPLVPAAVMKVHVMELERHIRDGTWPECVKGLFACPFPELCDTGVPDATEDWELEDQLRESLVHVRH